MAVFSQMQMTEPRHLAADSLEKKFLSSIHVAMATAIQPIIQQ